MIIREALVTDLLGSGQGLKLYDKQFPNGVTSFLETFYVVVQEIEQELQKNGTGFKVSPAVARIQKEMGHCGLYAYAETLTRLFETINKGKKWDGEWETAVWAFCAKHFKS